MNKTLIDGLKIMEIDIEESNIEKFDIFQDMILDWNQKINLTAIEDKEEFTIKHFLDSLTLLKTGKFEEKLKVLDIGTGAGFPGVPLKIMRDDLDITLLDSLKKRLNFIDLAIDTLKLKHIQTLHGRAEDYAQNKKYREGFDLVVSRAVANLSTLSEYCLPYVKKNGYFIAMKGPIIEEEIQAAKYAIRILGGEIVERVDVHIPFSELHHNLLIIKKVASTPKQYPRQAGKPKKEPL